jgi:uncharacterized protein YdhG (YjbR/CyaY superfamily)
MPASEIDAYLAELDETKRSTLDEVRRRILEVIPDAEQTISYRCPAFKVDGKVVAGFAAFKDHLSYLPHSGSTLPALKKETSSYGGTKSALHFPVDEPLPRELIKQLVETRLRETRG